MSALVADTHAAIWYLSDRKRLSGTARIAMDSALHGGDGVQVSAVSLIEVLYLVEKGKLLPAAHSDLLATLLDPKSGFQLADVNLAVCQAAEKIPRKLVPDFPDRIIAATALALGVPLVTCDPKIQAAPIQTIW